jgi:hypothetical protein
VCPPPPTFKRNPKRSPSKRNPKRSPPESRRARCSLTWTVELCLLVTIPQLLSPCSQLLGSLTASCSDALNNKPVMLTTNACCARIKPRTTPNLKTARQKPRACRPSSCLHHVMVKSMFGAGRGSVVYGLGLHMLSCALLPLTGRKGFTAACSFAWYCRHTGSTAPTSCCKLVRIARNVVSSRYTVQQMWWRHRTRCTCACGTKGTQCRGSRQRCMRASPEFACCPADVLLLSYLDLGWSHPRSQTDVQHSAGSQYSS